MRKVYFEGTHRIRRPELTWEVIAPELPTFGVSRVADVTRLDRLGIPVYVSVRPLGRTLSVAQGKGATHIQARVSAAMEAIEIWHAELACPPSSLIGVPSRELDLPYRLDQLQLTPGSLVTTATPQSWVIGRTVPAGTPVAVPRDCVQLSRVPAGRWWAPGIKPTGNGLASGNSYCEAVLHGLYEVIERDAVSRLPEIPPDQRTYLRLDSVDDDLCVRVLDRFRSAGVWLEVVVVDNRWRLPCFLAYAWSQDHAQLATGCGIAASAQVALARALTETAQSRLNVISGARDDLGGRYYRPHLGFVTAAPTTRGELVPWSGIGDADTVLDTDVSVELSRVSDRFQTATSLTPMAVDLTTVEGIAVVKVIAPGLGFAGGHGIRRGQESSR